MFLRRSIRIAPEDRSRADRDNLRSLPYVAIVSGDDVARRSRPAVGDAQNPPVDMTARVGIAGIGRTWCRTPHDRFPVDPEVSAGAPISTRSSRSADGRLIAQTQAGSSSLAAPAFAVRRPGQPARPERRPVVRPTRTR